MEAHAQINFETYYLLTFVLYYHVHKMFLLWDQSDELCVLVLHFNHMASCKFLLFKGERIVSKSEECLKH